MTNHPKGAPHLHEVDVREAIGLGLPLGLGRVAALAALANLVVIVVVAQQHPAVGAQLRLCNPAGAQTHIRCRHCCAPNAVANCLDSCYTVRQGPAQRDPRRTRLGQRRQLNDRRSVVDVLGPLRLGACCGHQDQRRACDRHHA